MFSLNRATVIGNATRDPEIRMTPSGQQVATFSVATNRRWTTQSGETQEATEYHDIVAWGKLAEIIAKIVQKGKKVYVEGRLQTRTWETPDAQRRQKTEIVLENFVPLSPKPEGPVRTEPEVDVMGPKDLNIPQTAISPAALGEEKTEEKPAAKEKKADDETKKNKVSDEKAKAGKPAGDEEIDLDDIPF